MTNRFLLSVAAAALIAGTGFANAQGTGTAPSAGSTAQQSAPDRGAPSAATPMNRNDASDSKGSDSGMKSTQSEEKMQREGGKNQRAQDNMKKNDKSQRAQDNTKGEKSKSTSSETNDNGKSGKDMKAEGRNGTKTDSKSAAEGKSSTTTTGQAGAGAKLSTEQRTKVTTVIKNEHIRPETNVNFSISVGTRVPRDVHFHPLPAEIVTIYPDWRGYEFFLVRDQIIVVNPRTLDIVAVLDA